MTSFTGIPIVSGKEMARLEKSAYEAGFSEENFMHDAGEKVGKGIEQFLKSEKKPIHILIGKGNNGGDGFVAGMYLLSKGYPVFAHGLFPFEECSPLCQKNGNRFCDMGGAFTLGLDFSFEDGGVIVDGLLGTGFKGELKSPFLEMIEKANAAPLKKVAIDIPSGVNANTGEVLPAAFKADLTIFLGLAKIGFFISEGFDYLGKIRYGYFGLEERFTEKAETFGYLVDEEKLKKALPKIERTRHKYEAGYVVGVAGSKGMGGAAKLASLASLRAGAGITRLFHPEEAAEEMENAPLEIIREIWSEEKILEAEKKASAFFIGPGMGKSEEAKNFLQKIVPKIAKPCVIDADALFFLKDFSLPKETVITPHIQEMHRLIPEADPKDPLLFHEAVQKFCEEKKIGVVLKGAPTWIFFPDIKPFVIPRGDPGMATAGTGDVLTGMIAALLAQKCTLLEAAILGVTLHAIAGEITAQDKTSFGVIASDLIEHIPDAIKDVLCGLVGIEIF